MCNKNTDNGNLKKKIALAKLSLFLQIFTKSISNVMYRGADKSLARPGRKEATATEDFEFHISYL
jgi:hypothetical protein